MFVVRHWILSKTVLEGTCLSPPRVELEGSKDLYGWNITYIEKTKNTFHLWLNAAKNTHPRHKTFKIKVVRRWILSKKVPESICLSPPPWEWARGLEIFIWLKYYIYRNGKKYIPFNAQCCWNYPLQPRNLQIKVVRCWILCKKVPEGICLPPPRVHWFASKFLCNIILGCNYRSRFSVEEINKSNSIFKCHCTFLFTTTRALKIKS